MRLPFVRRKTHEDALARANETIRERNRQLSRLGHRVVQVKQEHAKLLSDLRVVRMHIEYPGSNSDTIGFSFQMPGAVFDSFRHDGQFVELLALMIERSMHETPEGRSALAGYFR